MNTGAQYLALSRRAIVNMVRQPASIIPAMVFPLMFMAMSSAAFNRTTSLPTFPDVESFGQFLIATTIIQGSLFGAIGAGSDMATDIEDGFFERLIASPVARTPLLMGRLSGAALLGFVQAWFFFGVTSLFGLHVVGGVAGMFAVSIVSAVVGAGIGSVAMAFALRTGSKEAVQGAFPMLFAGLFLSSAFFPRTLMSGWFKTVATWNPLSHMIEGLRSIVIAGLDAGEFLTALGVAAGILTVGVSAALLALRRRLAVAA